MKKKVFIKRQKTEFIPSSKLKCPKSGIFVNNNWWGESGKAILQASIAEFFFGQCQNISSGKDGSAPL